MKKQILKKIMVLAVAANFVLSACPVFSQEAAECEGNGPWGRRHEKGEYRERMKERREKFAEELSLTDEQKEEMKELRKANKEKKKELRGSLKEKQKELRNELNVYDSDTRKVRSLVSEVKGLQGELIDLRVQSIMDTKGILTEEQFGKFTAKMKKHKGHRGRKGNKKRRKW